jgi:dimethylglycine dehydrogenase
MLNEAGRLIGDFTVARVAADRFFVVGSGAAEQYHMRWWERQKGSMLVDIRAEGVDLVGLAIAGPKSRELLARLARVDVSNSALPLFAIREFDIGMIPARVARASYTGEVGYEIWVRPEWQRLLYDTLLEAGRDLGIRNFGARALNSLRLEKGYGSWAREYRPIYGPCAANLERFVRYSRGDFIGGAGALAEKTEGPAYRLVLLCVETEDADAFGDEPIQFHGKSVGYVTSGGFGHTTGMSLAMGYVASAVATQTTGFEIDIIGERRPARRLISPPYDAEGLSMRG